jgi:dextranase
VKPLHVRTSIRRSAGALTVCAALLAAGCTNQKPVRVDTIADGSILKQVTTDKAIYKPGDVVKFDLTLQQLVPKGTLLVRYKQLNETVKEEELKLHGDKLSWDWTPPRTDGKGYMAELVLKQDGKLTDHTNIAVDVSSDWGKFPRYGYLADYPKLDEQAMNRVIDRLNRFHINGIQFYDWQYKHQMPVKWDNGKPAAAWQDIANRTVLYDTVKGYIDLAHKRNMKAMNYNLLFGAYRNAEQDGVNKEWGLFKDPLHMSQDKHPLPSSWASDIYLYDPSNQEWQNYLLQAEKRTFAALPFDGFHVDQLGDRGTLWNYEGKSVNLALTYGDFLKKAKQTLNVDLVMNAVGQYGQGSIAQGPVKFLYSEVWGSHPQFRNLKDIVDQNNKYGKNQLNTVFAAYLNYNLANAAGQFNAPGVLLADAVMFALGGSHLELGENMLAKEYFPNRNLKIPSALEEQLISYYDFLVAYQNLLRDGAQETSLEIGSSEGVQFSKTAEKGKVWSFSKEKDGKDIVHLINLTDATTLNWNDTDGKQAEPQQKDNVVITVTTDKKAKNIWLATPDSYHGSPVAAAFKQENGRVQVTIPHLKYWDMVVVEYE